MFNKSILASLILLVGSTAQASINCDPAGSSGSILTPSFLTNGPFSGYFFVTNVSDEEVTVNLDVTDFNGNIFTPTSLLYAAKFSGSNTPISSSGATLQPGEMGEIVILNGDSSGRVNVGKLSWQSSACLDSALMVNHFNEYSDSSRYSGTALQLNGGQPF